MDIWNTRGAVKTLTGMDPDELDADTFVAPVSTPGPRPRRRARLSFSLSARCARAGS